MKLSTIATVCFLGLSVAGVCLPGQNLVWQRTGVQDTYSFGAHVDVIGDVNMDGVPDLFTFVFVPINAVYEPEYWILSGATSETLRRRRYSNQYLGWRSVREYGIAGDHDGDGMVDWWWSLTGSATPQVRVQVRSTADDKVLFEVGGDANSGFGLAAVAGLNIDGDGKPDVAVTALRSTSQAPGGEVHVFRNDGHLLYRTAPPDGYWMSWGLANLGDLDDDGSDEVGATCAEPRGSGAVIVFSGATGNVLHVSLGEQPWDRMDQEIAAAGDVDRDGVQDYAAGGFWGSQRGTVRIFSGRTGLPLRTYVSTDLQFGCYLAGGIDADLDGVVDLLAMSPTDKAIHCLSGRTGTMLFKLRGEGFGPGSGCAVLPPRIGNPFPCVVYPEPQYESRPNRLPPYLGRIVVMRTDPPGSAYLGSGCTSPPPLGAGDIGLSLRHDGNGRVTLHNPAASLSALLVGASSQRWGAFPLPLDLGPFGLTGCSLRTSVDVVVPGIRVASDLALVDFPIPFGIWGALDPVFYAQWLHDESGCPRVSGGVRLRTR